MDAIQLFGLASRQAEWLSVRQNLVAGNIANANTPGFRGLDVEPFEAVLEQAGMRQAATHPAHFTESAGAGRIRQETREDQLGVNASGNTVSIEKEMMKEGEIKRAFELNAGLVKAFHRMMLLTVRKS